MFQPIARIAQQGGKALADFMVGNTEYSSRWFDRLPPTSRSDQTYADGDLLCMTRLEGRADEDCWVRAPTHMLRECFVVPTHLTLPGGQIGYEIGLFIDRQRCISFPLR